MDETFLLSNIAPQIGDGFNRHCTSSSSDLCPSGGLLTILISLDTLRFLFPDWAYFENFARKLTNEFTDVYVFTIPLYLPTKSPVDGKWRVVSLPPSWHTL